MVRLYYGQYKLLGLSGVLIYLKIPELTEFLPAVIELAGKRLCLIMDNLVGPDIAFLCKIFPAYMTLVGSLARMTAFMSLQKN